MWFYKSLLGSRFYPMLKILRRQRLLRLISSNKTRNGTPHNHKPAVRIRMTTNTPIFLARGTAWIEVYIDKDTFLPRLTAYYTIVYGIVLFVEFCDNCTLAECVRGPQTVLAWVMNYISDTYMESDQGTYSSIDE
ncbi:hypothetical protein K439DRAFT_710711 [Ramaria rubella]|nr:hypothetical protein K439DRAFT_710711 [Ramaria rubella]